MDIIELRPVFTPKIWGGEKIKEKFNFDINEKNIGELWCVSAIEGSSNAIDSNLTFKDFYCNNKEKFNIDDIEFPLLVKIIDAKDDLSIQVHPDDDYAKLNHNCLGKNECWYILDLENNDQVIFGTNAKNKYELISNINNNDFESIIRNVKINRHDFLDVQVGMIHAIKAGTLLYELQQSSDITYRLYDYNRLEQGKKRQLHLKESIDVITYDNIEPNTTMMFIDEYQTRLIHNEYFVLDKISVNNELSRSFNMPFLLITCVDGEGTINNYSIKAGNSLVIVEYNQDTIKFIGNIELMIASSKII